MKFNEKALLALADFPLDLIWMFFVDGNFWEREKGYKGYETREPGSVYAAIIGLARALKDITKFEFTTKILKIFMSLIPKMQKHKI